VVSLIVLLRLSRKRKHTIRAKDATAKERIDASIFQIADENFDSEES
jgi:hypothetical protein